MNELNQLHINQKLMQDGSIIHGRKSFKNIDKFDNKLLTNKILLSKELDDLLGKVHGSIDDKISTHLKNSISDDYVEKLFSKKEIERIKNIRINNIYKLTVGGNDNAIN